MPPEGIHGPLETVFMLFSGMLVEGYVDMDGEASNKVHLKLRNETTLVNHTTVRLEAGPSEYEGRLEVRPSQDQEWGTVCNKVSVYYFFTTLSVLLGNSLQNHQYNLHPKTVFPKKIFSELC